MKNSITALMVALVALVAMGPAAEAAKMKTPKNAIVCTEIDADKGKIGLYTVVLDQEGRPTQLKLQRKAFKGFKTVAWKFTSEDGLMINKARAADEGTDEQTAELDFAESRFSDVESIEVSDSLGQSFSLSIDERNPSDSKVVFKTPTKTASSENTTEVICQARRDAPQAPIRTMVGEAEEEQPVTAPVVAPGTSPVASSTDVARRPSKTE